jgi:uncharacterized membrane protein
LPVVAETTLSSVVGWIFVALLLAIWIYLLVVVFSDVFSRSMSAWAKAGWVLIVILLPLFGILIYLVTRPKPAVGRAAEVDEQPTTADRLEALLVERDEGRIGEEEFARRRAELLG